MRMARDIHNNGAYFYEFEGGETDGFSLTFSMM